MDVIRSCESSKVRTGQSLNEAEKEYLELRRETVKKCLQQHKISCNEDEVPNIAVLGSGGGLRAMIGLLGSLSQLSEEGLLDSVKYLSGVSGSTWCMASLFKQENWSNNIKDMKKTIVDRLANGSISPLKKCDQLVKYYTTKDNYSLTDVWAATVVSTMVKEIDEERLTEQRGRYTNDPYPIYNVIDKQSKYDKLNKDVWFEITPDECGYSLSGAFVDSSCYASKFENGQKIKDQPEIDILYLQGLCGSALADEREILKELLNCLNFVKASNDTTTQSFSSRVKIDTMQTKILEGCEELQTLVELNLCALEGKDLSSYCNVMNDLMKGKNDENGQMTLAENATSEELKDYTLRVCSFFSDQLSVKSYCDKSGEKGEMILTTRGMPEEFMVECKKLHFPTLYESSFLSGQFNGLWKILQVIADTLKKFALWKWGTTHNYLYNMKVEETDPSVLSSNKRNFEDAGLLLNSPYFSVLRKERNIDLIISLDFSAGDPFATVVQTAEKCKDLKVPFPEVDVPNNIKEPQDFYAFQGHSKAPTVIHMPLFNHVNCEDEVEKWKNIYSTKRLSYSKDEIEALLEKAALNITNNKEKILTEIRNITEQKKMSKLG